MQGHSTKDGLAGEVCVGSPTCVPSPDVLESRDENLPRAVHSDAEDEDLLRKAAEACPVQATILEDDQGAQMKP